MEYYLRTFFYKYVLLTLFSIYFIESVCGQKQTSSFDSIYVDAATSLAAIDIQKAISVADSLLINSTNSHQEMKSLMLIATLKGRTGDVVETLSNAIQAEEIAKRDNNYEWQVRIGGFLSTTFRGINLTEEAKKYLAVAEKANKKTKTDSPSYSIIQAFIHQEKAFYKIGEENYHDAIEELRKAEVEISKTPQELRNKIFLATNYQLLGDCFLKLQDYEKASENYNLSLTELDEQDSELKGFLYVGIGDVEMYYKRNDAALQYYKKAENYIQTSDNFNLKSSVYQKLSNYYKTIGEKGEAIKYNEMYLTYIHAHAKSTKVIFNQLLKQIHLEREKESKSNNYFLGVSAFLLSLVLFLIVYYSLLRVKQRKKYEDLIGSWGKVSNFNKLENPSLRQNESTRNYEKISISQETVERLLSELEKLEEDAFFTQADISLTIVAAKLQTNPRYVSYIIHTHRMGDFSNYINKLRVNFILNKFRDDPEYLEYKLSYIAKELGFSSHSKFASVFKTITGISPSVFIFHLKKEKMKAVEA